MPKQVGPALAELLGAFALMFVGGAAILHGESLLTIALAHGLVLGVTVTAFMHVSGGQFNPAVSIALAIIKKQSWSQAGLFSVAQLVGATLAALILRNTFSAEVVEANSLGATLGSLTGAASEDSVRLGMAFLLEVVATFFLMCVIMGSAVDERGVGKSATVGGMAIGLIVSANILAIGPLTGASMNPSRSFGPALVGGHWDAHWLYWLAPVVGAALAALFWTIVLGLSDDPNVESPEERGRGGG